CVRIRSWHCRAHTHVRHQEHRTTTIIANASWPTSAALNAGAVGSDGVSAFTARWVGTFECETITTITLPFILRFWHSSLIRHSTLAIKFATPHFIRNSKFVIHSGLY